MNQPGSVRGLITACGEFELLGRNWNQFTLACTCSVQVKAMVILPLYLPTGPVAVHARYEIASGCTYARCVLFEPKVV